MALTNEVTTLRRCTACGDLVEIDANFCPSCGTRQVDGIPRDPEPETGPVEPAGVAPPPDPATSASATGWLLAAGLVGALVILGLGLLVGRLLPGGDGGGDGAGGSAAGPAARAMDGYAPLAEGWQAKHEHVAQQGTGDDAAGLATAAHDARAWIDLNSEDLTAVAGHVPGGAGPLYRQLLDIYARRFTVLADIEAIGTAGGTGLGSGADELAELDALDQQADTVVCAIDNVMHGEGDDPADHVTPAMAVTC